MKYPKRKLKPPFRTPPTAEGCPTRMQCERQGCMYQGVYQNVIGVWDQPQTFVDPSRVFLLACGHEVL